MAASGLTFGVMDLTPLASLRGVPQVFARIILSTTFFATFFPIFASEERKERKRAPKH